MSNTVIPANPGFWVEVEGNRYGTPVLAWIVCDGSFGVSVKAVTAGNHEGPVYYDPTYVSDRTYVPR